MANQYKIRCLLLVFLLVCVSLSLGCAIGVTRVKVSHDPLNPIQNKGEGNFLVNEFKDVRPQAKEYIGNKRNMYGMVLGHIGTEQGVSLTETLTTYFGEALREAGYTVVISKESYRAEDSGKMKFDAMIDGEINEFWLDLYMAVWHKAAVRLMVKNPNSREVLWEKVIRGQETNALWWGVTSEYEKVIRQALTKALNNAASEFASEEFRKVLKLEKPPTTPEMKSSKDKVEPTTKPQLSPPEKPQVTPPEKPTTSSPLTSSSGTANIVTVTWTFANIRSGAGNDHPVTTAVKKGDKLTIIGEVGDWLNVRLENGQEGWIGRGFVKK